MKKLLLILTFFSLISCRAQWSGIQTSIRLQDTMELAGFTGPQDRAHILTTNQDWILCTPCVVNGVSVIKGQGFRKWKLFNTAKVDTIWRVAGIDSTYFTVNGRVHAILDSAGGGNDSTFAKNDLTATGDRTHDFNGHYLHIGNLSEFDVKSYAGAGAFVSTINSNGSSIGWDVNFVGVGSSSIGLSWNQVHLIPNPGGFVRIENLSNYTVGDSSYHFLVANGNGDVYLGDSLYRVGSGGGTSTGTVTSVGLSMPSAFNVANSPVTSAGTFSVTGAGTATQTIAGNGTLVNNKGLSALSYSSNTLTATLVSGETVTTTINTTAARDSLFGVLDNLATADRSFSQGSGNKFTWGGTWTSTTYHMIEFSNTGTGATGVAGFLNNSTSETVAIINQGGGAGLTVDGTTGAGIFINVTTGLPIRVGNSTPSGYTSYVSPMLQIYRTTSGTAANGIGSSIDFNTQSSSGSSYLSNQIISEWTNATTASRTSRFRITGYNSATSQDIFYNYGNGDAELPVVGSGLILKSPDGTKRVKLTIDNSGAAVWTTL